MNEKTCENCGETVLLNVIQKDLCPDCFADAYGKCSDCDDIVEIDTLTEISDDLICEDCLANDYIYCESCNETVHTDNSREIDNEYLCNDCVDRDYFRCDRCSEYAHNDNRYETNSGECVCRNCYENHYFCCEYCDETYSNDYYGSNGHCQDCEEPSEDCDGVFSHDYKPEPEFKKSNKDKLKHYRTMYFGIELECKGNRIEEAVECMLPFMYAKHDSSIGGGVEIVSHPTTFDSWIEEKSNIDDWLDNLRRLGFSSHNGGTCGMHIHISKNTVSTLQLYKVLRFTYENHDFMLAISQRMRRQLDEWADMSGNRKSAIHKAAAKMSFGRFEAWNLQNSDTIECRIFRGNLRLDRFYKNVEFVHAIIMWAKNVSLNNINLESFCNYVFYNRKQYSNLWSFMSEKYLCV